MTEKKLLKFKRDGENKKDRDKFIDSINKNRLYLSCPMDFNDVYDIPQLCLNFNDFNEEYIEALKPLISCILKNLKFPNKFLPTNNLECLSCLDGLLNEVFRKMLKVSCFSFPAVTKKPFDKNILPGEDNSILMFAHYTDNHQGLALQYSYDTIYNNLKLQKNTKLIKIKYSNKNHFPCPIDMKGLQILLSGIIKKQYNGQWWKQLSSIIGQKMSAWKYENEYRILSFRNESDYIDIPSGSLNTIYFGAKMDRERKVYYMRQILNKNIIYKCCNIHWSRYCGNKSAFITTLCSIENPCIMCTNPEDLLSQSKTRQDELMKQLNDIHGG